MRLSDLAGNNNRSSSAHNHSGVLGLVAKPPDWRNTHIQETLGAAESNPYMRDAAKSFSRREKLHGALDAMLCRMNKTQDDGQRLHAALDKLLDDDDAENQSQLLHDLERPENQNEILHEPAEAEGDEEQVEDDGEENEKHEKVKIPYDKEQVPTLDALQHSLDAILGLDSAGLSRVVAMDAIKLGEPGDNAGEALGKFGITFNVNTRAKLPWFSTLRNWVAKYPQGTKIRDLDQSTLQKLMHELYVAA
jgi:hypothetical protein